MRACVSQMAVVSYPVMPARRPVSGATMAPSTTTTVSMDQVDDDPAADPVPFNACRRADLLATSQKISVATLTVIATPAYQGSNDPPTASSSPAAIAARPAPMSGATNTSAGERLATARAGRSPGRPSPAI